MRRYLLIALGLALIVGSVSIAEAANTQKLKATFLPKAAPKHGYVGGSIEVTALTGSTTSKIAPPADSKTYFDDDLSFDFKGLPTCNPATIKTVTTPVAKRKCAAAQVGTGDAVTAINGDPSRRLNEQVTAFNGPLRHGKPTLVLHNWARQLGLIVVVVGTISSTHGTYGHVLDIPVPPLPLNSSLIKFHVTVKRNFRYHGKVHHYLLGSCHDSDHTWHFRSAFKYRGAPPRADNATEKCTVKG